MVLYGTARRIHYTLNPTLKCDDNGDVIDEKNVVVVVVDVDVDVNDVEDVVNDR